MSWRRQADRDLKPKLGASTLSEREKLAGTRQAIIRVFRVFRVSGVPSLMEVEIAVVDRLKQS
jgi:hypothetical protein